MIALPFVAVFVLIVIVLLAFIIYFSARRERELFKKTGKYPVGYYQQQGMGVGLSFGVMFGLALNNMALGISLGLVFGLAIGAAWEKKHAHKLRPLTKKEQVQQRKAGIVGLIAGIVVALIVFAFFISIIQM